MVKPNKHGNYKRILKLDKIRERFRNNQKLHDFEVDLLFAKERHRPFTDIQYRYLSKGIRYQGVFDIETADFNPLHKFIICYDMIIRDIVTGKEEHVLDRITRPDIKKAVKKLNFNFDYRLLQTLSWNLHQCDQIVGHFSSKFDMPYFRSRCLLTKQPDLIPPYGLLRFGDTWRMMKMGLKAPRNTLRNFIVYTGGKDDKTQVDLLVWFSIYFHENPKWTQYMNYISTHCTKDVRMTVSGLKQVEKFSTIGMAFV